MDSTLSSVAKLAHRKIALVGAQGTGKSTFLAELEKLPIVKELVDTKEGVLIKEVVRSLVKERGITINKDGSHESQMIILEAHYHNALTNKSFITDRGAIDAYAYATYNYLAGRFTYEQHEQHRSIFEATLPFYTELFYLPIEFAVEDDGFRDTDEEFRHAIDKIYQQLFKRYNLHNVIPFTGSIEQRVQQFSELFKEAQTPDQQ